MSAPLQVVRFTPAVPAASNVADSARPVLEVHLGTGPAPAGQIVEWATPAGDPAWRYVLIDGRASGLESSISRLDLETLVSEYYFDDLLHHRRSA